MGVAFYQHAFSQVYQNAKMLSKQGELLCHCDLRKLECELHAFIFKFKLLYTFF